MGASVALELALRLRDDGANVDALVCLDAPGPGTPAGQQVDAIPSKLASGAELDREQFPLFLEEERQLRQALEVYQPKGNSEGMTVHLIATGEALCESEAWQRCGVSASDILMYANEGGREAASAIQRILAAQRAGGKSFEGYVPVRSRAFGAPVMANHHKPSAPLVHHSIRWCAQVPPLSIYLYLQHRPVRTHRPPPPPSQRYQQVSVSITPTSREQDAPFACAAGQSEALVPAAQCAEAFAQVVSSLASAPKFLLVTSSAPSEQVQRQLALLRELAPSATIHAVSSLRFVLGTQVTYSHTPHTQICSHRLPTTESIR